MDQAVGEADPADYDALVLPGGGNPDQLPMVPATVELARAMFAGGKPAAVICHGPWTLVEADLVRWRTLTSWPSLQTDIRNAGGTWVDAEVRVCTEGPNTLVTSRKPDDLRRSAGSSSPRASASRSQPDAALPRTRGRAGGAARPAAKQAGKGQGPRMACSP